MLTYSILIALAITVSCITYSNRFNSIHKKWALILLLVVMISISAFRFDVGADYQHFINQYNSIKKNGLEGSYTEIGFTYLAFILGMLGFDGQIIYVVGAILLGGSLYYAVRHFVPEKYSGFACFLFICLGFFFSSMNIARQYYAIALCTLGVVTLSKTGSGVKCALLILAGALFHTSAVIMLALLALHYLLDFSFSHGKHFATRNKLFLAYLVIYIASLLFIVIDVRKIILVILPYFDRWAGYQDSAFFINRNYSAVLKLVVPNILFIILLVLIRKRRLGAVDSVGMNLFLCYVVSQNMFYGITVLTRLSEYFYLGYVWSVVRVGMVEEEESKRKLYFLAVALYAILLTVTTIFVKGGNGVMPYASIFFRSV